MPLTPTPPATARLRSRLLVVIAAAAVLAAAVAIYRLQPERLPPGLAMGNGRLEATEVDVATKVAGRLASIGPREGDRVDAGQVVAVLDAEDLAAQLRAASAQVRQAREATREAREAVRKAGADAAIARRTLQRSQELVQRGFVSSDKLDRDRSAQQGAEAGLAGAQVHVAEAEAAVETAIAREQSLRATLNDTSLKAPIAGRVLYRLAEPGEVLPAGGKALTLLDLDDVFMTIYLSTADSGKVALGSPARIVLDALPGKPIPATVSFVAPKAQFTPREVETKNEREKLMFRVKVRVDAAWLAQHQDIAKPGMPGVAYVRVDGADAAVAPDWPARLQAR